MELNDGVVNQPVVIDSGSGDNKAGFAGDQIPKCRLPNYIKPPKQVRVMAGALEGDLFVVYSKNFSKTMKPLDVILNRNFSIWNYAKCVDTEENAVAAAKAWLLVPTATPKCSSCYNNMHKESHMGYKVGYRWRCRRAGCNLIANPLQNTFFRQNIAIEKTMRLLYHFFRNDKVSVAAIDVNVTRKSAIHTYHFLRKICAVAETHDRQLIGGDNDVVEIDIHSGRLLRQTRCFGIISRLTKQLHVEIITDTSRDTLDPIMAATIQTDSYIISDTHSSYNGIHLRLGMRGHSTVDHSRNFVNGTVVIPVHTSLGKVVPGTEAVLVKVHVNTIGRQWLELKRHLGTCRCDKRLKWYLGEYMYRQNVLRRLPSDAARFRRLLRDISRVWPGLGRRGIKAVDCRCSDHCPRITSSDMV